MSKRQSDYSSDREQAEGAGARADIQRSLGRIEGKLDSLANTVTSHVMDDKASFATMGNRLSTLEYKVYAFGGGLALILSAPALLNYFK